MEVKGFCSVHCCQTAQQASVTPWVQNKNWMSVLSLCQIQVQKCSDFFNRKKRHVYGVLAASDQYYDNYYDQYYDNYYSAKAAVCLVGSEK